MLAIIDYGASNLKSVANAFAAIGADARVVQSPEDLEKADAIVLPGVGAFGDCMAALRASGMIAALEDQVLGRQKPYLGICLGMQILAARSEEHGDHAGLGWLDGEILRIKPEDPRYRIPHMGWNDVTCGDSECRLWKNIPSPSTFYFVHTYHFVPGEKGKDEILSRCFHGVTVTAAVRKKHIYGVQFHPEKSQQNGLDLLRNFMEIIRG